MGTGTGQKDNWIWEVTSIKLRKAGSYGKPYTAVVDFIVVNGTMYAVGMLAERFTKQDHITLKKIAKYFGYDKVHFARYKDVGIISKIV